MSWCIIRDCTGKWPWGPETKWEVIAAARFSYYDTEEEAKHGAIKSLFEGIEEMQGELKELLNKKDGE